MAITEAPKVAVPADPMANIGSTLLSNLLGTGTQTTTQTPGNVDVLNQAVAGLRAQDPAALLQSIFQQAGGQIPGLQVALSNAIGARSGGNSAVQQALMKLLQQTTLAGQQQLVDQQQRNLATQVQAGGSIAQATKGTEQKTTAGDPMSALKGLAILQLMSKSGLMEKLGLGSKAGQVSPGGNVTTPAQAASFDAEWARGMSGTTEQAGAPLSAAPQIDFTQMLGGDYPVYEQPPAEAVATPVSQPDVTPADIPAPAPAMDTFEQDWFDALNDYSMPEYANGGLVKGATDEESAEQNAVNAFDPGALRNKLAESLVALIAAELGGAKKSEHGYADGGVVRAGGSRRSLNPSVELFKPTGTGALDTGLQRAASASNVPANIMAGDFMRRRQLSPLSPMLGNEAGTVGKMTSLGSTVNTLSRSLTGDTKPVIDLGGNEQYLGDAAALLTARNPEDLAWYGASKVVPGGQYAGAARALSEGNTPAAARSALDASLYAVNPALGAVNSISSLVGGPDIGERLVTWFGDPVSHIGDVVEEGVGNIGKTAGEFISNPVGTASDTVSHWGDVISSVFGWKEGGHIQGPGTGTSDSIPAKLSDGEYVIPADVVEKLGVEFFDRLRDQFHQPVRG